MKDLEIAKILVDEYTQLRGRHNLGITNYYLDGRIDECFGLLKKLGLSKDIQRQAWRESTRGE